MFDFLQKQGASAELAELIVELAAACKRISEVIVGTSTGKAGSMNVFGEEQLALDVQADKIIDEHLRTCPFVAAYCSEELDGLVHVRGEDEGGRFSVFHDPLDGSSLVNVNLAVGTIIGIYEGAEVLGRTPRDQVAAMFAVYGPRTTIMVTVGKGVHEFTLTNGEWQVTDEDVKMGSDKKYFAPGNLRACKEREDYFQLVNWYIQQQYTLRYSGGMVPDINHILKKGAGVFMYPGYGKQGSDTERGKLRLLYECGPMAMLMEQAGGAASAGSGYGGCKAILDVKIEELVQRTPIFIGQKEEVERCERELG